MAAGNNSNRSIRLYRLWCRCVKDGIGHRSRNIDLSLTLISFVVGLVVFREWDRVSIPQYLGLGLGLAAIALMLLFPKT